MKKNAVQPGRLRTYDKSLRLTLITFLTNAIFGSGIVQAQAIDYSNCPTCTTQDITFISEVNTLYQGIKGFNPSVPSTYNLIGNRKYSGSGYPVLNSFFGENWYPIRTEKQHLTGTLQRFGVSNYGDESDWNIHIVPDPVFSPMVSEAIPYRRDNWYADGNWNISPDGRIMIEAEITPDEHRYGNPWFNNFSHQSSLVNRKVSVYGPFVREEAHGNHPEIHPCEQIWWKEGDNAYMVLLMNDDSNRFDDRADTVVTQNGKSVTIKGDYTPRRVTTYAYQPWSPNRNQEAEVWVAFELNPAQGGLKLDVQAMDRYNFYGNAAYPDVAAGDKYSITYNGNVVLTVQESADLDPNLGVQFKNVCYNPATGILQGYVVLNTSVGNGNGREGFVVLHINKRPVPLNARPVVVTGNLANQWLQLGAYHEEVAFSDIITSDMYGTGMVDGMIDFNGNGKTDFFTKKGDRWLVLYDGVGTWQEIGSSSIDVSQLRFGDVDGDGKTDILRIGPNYNVFVSYGGTTQWAILTSGGKDAAYLQVADFNGDNRTDLVYFDYFQVRPNPPLIGGDMYVKYSGAGSWKKISNQYHLENAQDYVNNFRFGDFNGDGITDVFRNSKGRFGVYWAGMGSFKEITRPGFTANTADLLFAGSLALTGYTDIIHVDRNTKQWTIFYKGYEVSPLPIMKYNDPLLVRFGDINTDAAWEIISTDYEMYRVPPSTVVLNPVAPAVHEAGVMARYVSSSLRKNTTTVGKKLNLDMSLEHFPGNTTAQARIVAPGSPVEWIKNQQNGQSQPFVINAAFNAVSGEQQTMARITNIELSGASENKLEVKFRGQTTPRLYKIPTLAISGEKSNVREKLGGSAPWQPWNQYLASTVSSPLQILLDTAPATPVFIEELQVEIIPLYASPEGNEMTLEEIDEVAHQMNMAAYSYDTAIFNKLFTNKNVFNLNWQFELKDLATGAVLPVGNMVVTKGRWVSNKIVYSFPVSSSLLQLKATVVITDEYGHTNRAPQSYFFYNQKIPLTNSPSQMTNWLAPLLTVPVQAGYIWVRDHWERLRANEHYFTYDQLLTRAKFLGDDKALTPAEINEITGAKRMQ
jgi:FG-GAP-like repeat